MNIFEALFSDSPTAKSESRVEALQFLFEIIIQKSTNFFLIHNLMNVYKDKNI